MINKVKENMLEVLQSKVNKNKIFSFLSFYFSCSICQCFFDEGYTTLYLAIFNFALTYIFGPLITAFSFYFIKNKIWNDKQKKEKINKWVLFLGDSIFWLVCSICFGAIILGIVLRFSASVISCPEFLRKFISEKLFANCLVGSLIFISSFFIFFVSFKHAEKKYKHLFCK